MSTSWLDEFELQLQRLESGISPTPMALAPFLQHASTAYQSFRINAIVDFLVVTGEHVHRYVGEEVRSADESSILLLQQLTDKAAQYVKDVSDASECDTVEDTSAPPPLVTQHSLAESQKLIVLIEGGQLVCSFDQAFEAASAVGNLVAFRIGQQRLEQATYSSDVGAELLNVATKLQGAANLSDVHRVIAHESGRLFPDCRIVSMDVDGDSFQVQAITGSANVNAESAHVRGLEAVAGQLKQGSSENAAAVSRWTSVDDLSKLDLQGDRSGLAEILSDYRTTGVQHVALFCFEAQSAQQIAVLVESNQQSPPDVTQVSAGWNRLLPSVIQNVETDGRGSRRRKRRQRFTAVGVVIAAVIVSFFVPVDFELPVSGQLMARGRRFIFAPEDGMVKILALENEKQVEQGALLLEMQNSELSLRLKELDGQIATTQTAMATANARRLSRAQDGSAAEVQLLKQRLGNLEAERELVLQRVNSLRIRAPLSGVIVCRDALQTFTDRPLRRGQRIAEMIPQDNRWELELHIPQSYSAYLSEALSTQEGGLPLRYNVNSNPEDTHEAVLKSVEQFVYYHDGELIRNAVAPVKLEQMSGVRSGTSASVRVYCGRRSLGFVTTRRLLEYLQQLKFTWWG